MDEVDKSGKRERKPTSRFSREGMIDFSDKVSFAHSKCNPLKKKKKVETAPVQLLPLGRIIIKGGVDAAAAGPGTVKGGRGKNKKFSAAAPPVPAMTPKERDANEREENFINHICKSSLRRRRREKQLPVGSRENITAAQAIEQSVRDCTRPLLDWNKQRAKLIGYTIKMYFEGDMIWYRGRIINYDEQSDKHFVHFKSDNTGEWISLQEEMVLVGTEICAMKRTKTSKGYPAIRYWCSELAQPLMQLTPGWKKTLPHNNQYVEYFDPTKDFDEMNHEFVSLSQLYPLEPPHIPERPTKDLAARMVRVEEERSCVDSIVSSVVAEIKRALLREGAAPEDWVGARVRHSTHRILPRGALGAGAIREHGGAMRCLGTVAAYCPGTGKHLVLFDEEFLQPQWTTLSREAETETLIGPDIPEPPEVFRQYLARQQQDDCCCVCRVTRGADAEEELLRCEDCQACFHPRCLEPYEDMLASALTEAYRGAYEALVKSSRSKCMRCLRCSSCEDSAWTTPLAAWSLRRCDEQAPDSPRLYCGSCIYKYKHLRDFCSVCFKTYDRDEYADDLPISHSSHRSAEGGSADPNPSPPSADDAWGAIVDSQMVQCNQCDRWVHSTCEGLDQQQYEAICAGYHPVWGAEYLCPRCRVDINQAAVAQIRAQDKISMFADPVSEALAPDYYDKIRNPMDLQTMDSKAAKGMYKSLQSMRQDVELMCLNAVIFNKAGDEYYCHAVDFHDACMGVFDSLERKTTQTAFGAEMAEITREWREKQLAAAAAQVAAVKASKRTRWEEADDEMLERTRRARRAPPSAVPDPSSAAQAVLPVPVDTAALDGSLEEAPLATSSALASNDAGADDAAMMLVLPRGLRSCPDPESYFPVSVSLLSAEEAFYACCQDQCILCGSAGLHEAFLFCADCGEACHSFCADAPLLTMSAASRRQWRCSNCKVCERCGSADAAKGELLYCERCDQSFHETCVTPSYEKASAYVASGDFYCHNCVECGTCTKRTGVAWGMSSSGCQLCHEEWEKQGRLMQAEDERSTRLRRETCKVCRAPLGDNLAAACTMCGLSLHLQCGGVHTDHWVPVSAVHFCCMDCIADDAYHVTMNEESKVEGLGILSRIARIQRVRASNRWGSAAAVPALSRSYCGNKQLSLLLVKWATLFLQNVTAEQIEQKSPLAVYHDLSIKPGILGTFLGFAQKNPGAMVRAATEFVQLFKSYEFRLEEGADPSPLPEVSAAPVLAAPRPVLSSSVPTAAAAVVAVAAAVIPTAPTAAEASNPAVIPDVPSVMPATASSTKTRFKLVRTGKHALLEQCLEQDGSRELSSAELTRVASLAASLYVVVSSYYEHNLAYQYYSPTTLPLVGSANLLRHVVAEAVRAWEDDGAPCSASRALSAIAEESAPADSLKKYLVHGEYVEGGSAAGVAVSEQTLCLRRALLVALMEAAVALSAAPPAPPTDKASSLRKSKLAAAPEVQAIASKSGSSKAVVPFRAVSTLVAAIPPLGSFYSSAAPAPLQCTESYYARKAQLQVPSATFAQTLLEQATLMGAVARGIVDNVVTINKFAVSAHDAELIAIEEMRLQERAREAAALVAALAAEAAAAEAAAAEAAAAEAAAAEATAVDAAEAAAAEMTTVEATAAEATAAMEVVDDPASSAAAPDTEPAANTADEATPCATAAAEDAADTDEAPATEKDSEQPAAEEEVDTGRRQVKLMVKGSYAEPSGVVRMTKEKSLTAAAAANAAPAEAAKKAAPAAALIEVDLRLTPDCAPVSPAQLLALDEALLVLQKRVSAAGEGEPGYTHALRGWPADLLGPELPWADLRVCALCREAGEDPVSGQLLPFSDGPYAHANCLRWSHEVVERCDGKLLENALSARHRAPKMLCWLCKQRGGSVTCNACNKSFHLKCALAYRCMFIEACLECDSATSGPHDIHTLVYCPQHYEEAAALSRKAFNWARPCERALDAAALASSLWLPGPPLRGLVLDETDRESGAEPRDVSLPQELSRRRAERAVKSGALTVLCIGKTSSDHRDFHTEDHIYPEDFRSARIFWSMRTPFSRTLYIFDIMRADPGAGDGPLFKVTAADDRDHPLLSRSAEDLYATIVAAVRECCAAHAPAPRASAAGVYGLNAFQFFGLALPLVRHAIELIPDSVSAMFALPPAVQYKPSFKLPTELDVIRIQQKQMQATIPNRVSINGCARADVVESQAALSRGRRVTRILAKALDEEAERGDTGEGAPDPDLLSESKRQQEMSQYSYQLLAAAYLRNPFERLEVKKSHIHGWGLFARSTFEKDDMLVEYIGQKIRQAVADRREALYEEEGVGSCYLFRLDKDDIIDATRTGGMARFINHCCEPNAYARTVTVDPGNGSPVTKHIVIFAARDVQEGEEITYDYKFPIEETKLKCYCGATKCKTYLN